MEINGQLLYKFLSRARLAQAGFAKEAFGNVVYRVRRFYCRPMTVARTCDTQCAGCKARLIQAIENVKDADDPEAMLVYQLRRAVSELVEQEHTAAVRRKDHFGTPDNTDVWDAFLAEVPQ